MKIDNILDKFYIKFLFPKLAILKNVELTRYGSEYGGWAIPKGLLNSNSLLFSFGAGEDISFDISLAEANQCEVNIFDPTPKAISHFKDTSLQVANAKIGFLITSLQVASAKIGFLFPIFCYAKIHPLNTTRERPYFHDVGCQSHLLYNR